MMREELNLPRTVEEHIILAQTAKTLLQPVNIMFEFFHGI
jgi:hypothetical protein